MAVCAALQVAGVVCSHQDAEGYRQLKVAEFKAAQFPLGLDEPIVDENNRTVGIAVEVLPSRRAMAGALQDYKSDVWKERFSKAARINRLFRD